MFQYTNVVTVFYRQRFTAVVDRHGFASAVNAMQSNGTNADHDAGSTSAYANDNGDAKATEKFQYQRTYKLSLDLKDLLNVYTSEQFKQRTERMSPCTLRSIKYITNFDNLYLLLV